MSCMMEISQEKGAIWTCVTFLLGTVLLVGQLYVLYFCWIQQLNWKSLGVSECVWPALGYPLDPSRVRHGGGGEESVSV